MQPLVTQALLFVVEFTKIIRAVGRFACAKRPVRATMRHYSMTETKNNLSEHGFISVGVLYLGNMFCCQSLGFIRPVMEVAPAVSTSIDEERFVYVICPSHDLPQINCSQALKHVLLTEPHLQLCNRWLSQYKRWLAVLFLIGMSQVLAVPFLPANAGRVVVFFGLLELPALAAAMISLRYDMIRLILTTYEFRYISCLNVAFSVAAIMNYQDMRMLFFIPSFVSAELLALQDANFRALRFTIRIFCFIAIVQVINVLYVNLHLVDQWHTVQVFQYGKHAIMADNVVSNYFVITTIILLRNAYRKHRWVTDVNQGETTVVQCIAYRCRVRLCLQHTPEKATVQRPLDTKFAQMRLVPSSQLYDSDQMLLQTSLHGSFVRRIVAGSRWIRLWLYLIGAIGLTLTWTVLNLDQFHRESLPHHGGVILSISSATSTGLFCGFFISLYQRQLFIKLTTSFDFMFLSANIATMHLCAGSALAWTPRCFSLLASWIWIMWAITMDALTPDMRHALGMRRQYLIGVVTVFVLLVVTFVVELTFLQMRDLEDRIIFQVKTSSTVIQVRVFQLFFSCSISVLPMCFRIISRLSKATSGELILIQGAVEYDDDPLAQRRKREMAERDGSVETQSLRSSLTNSRMFAWLIRSPKVQPKSPGTSFLHVKFSPSAKYDDARP